MAKTSLLFIIVLLVVVKQLFAFPIIPSDYPKFDVPVWTLSTLNDDGVSTNMNIITYANQVGLRPSIYYSISLYKNTLSYYNFIKNGYALLSQLDLSHIDTVEILGKKSGKDVNKLQLLKDKNINITPINIKNLQGLSTYINKKKKNNNNNINDNKDLFLQTLNTSPIILAIGRVPNQSILNCGDHDLFLCEVLDSFRLCGSFSSSSSSLPLKTQLLRDKKII